eukprot:11927067-Alexandrium_andersonii.AAC.1
MFRHPPLRGPANEALARGHASVPLLPPSRDCLGRHRRSSRGVRPRGPAPACLFESVLMAMPLVLT